MRDRIIRTAQEMGYRPNRRAQQLRTGVTKTLAVQLDSSTLSCDRRRLTATLHMTVFQGVVHHARNRGYYAYLLMPPDNDDVGEIRKQVVDIRSFDGLIMLGLDEMPQKRLSSLCSDIIKAQVPAVSLDKRLIQHGVPFVGISRDIAIAAAAERIAELGHRHVAYIGYLGATYNEPESRHSVYRQCLAGHGIDLKDEDCFEVLTEVEAYRVVRSKFESWPADNRPTCLIFHGDHTAMAGMQAVYDLGLSVPDDVSIMGMNNAPYIHEAIVPLATIDHRYRDLGALLAKAVIDNLTDPLVPLAESMILPAVFVPNVSLGPVPTGTPRPTRLTNTGSSVPARSSAQTIQSQATEYRSEERSTQ